MLIPCSGNCWYFKLTIKMIKKIGKIRIWAVDVILKIHAGYFKFILKVMKGIDGKLKIHLQRSIKKKNKLRCPFGKEKE